MQLQSIKFITKSVIYFNNELIAKYWIPQVKVMKRSSQECKNDKASPTPPQMSKLSYAGMNIPVVALN